MLATPSSADLLATIAQQQQQIQALQNQMADYQVSIETNRQREQELIALKTRVISRTSHEFRTPLAIIASSAAILRDYYDRLDDEKRHHHLVCIEAYIQHITHLLDNILFLNQASTEQLPHISIPPAIEPPAPTQPLNLGTYHE
jgi:two-component system, sensor histidine kinase and response regulator